jgi:hypothetical protein
MLRALRRAKDRLISAVSDLIVEVMINAGGLNNSSEQLSLRAQVSGYSNLGDWKARNVAAAAAVGGASGGIGGPWAYAAEFGDLTYVFRTAARGAIGAGLMRGKEVDFEHDIALIVAVWGGAADVSDKIIAGKIAVAVGIANPATLSSSVHLTGKIIAKAAMKNHAAAAYIAKKATTKILAKYGVKLSTKWVPVFGGVASAAVNAWIVNSMIDAAEKYYASNFVILEPSVPIDP